MFELSAFQTVMSVAFLLAVVIGAVSAKTSFCTMGAVADWVNMGDLNRLRAWLLSILVAIVCVQCLQAAGFISLQETRIPYRSPVFYWPRYLLGGLLFGIGMTLAGGCAKKNLIRLGGGNCKSLLVLLIAGLMAWLMMRTSMYARLFEPWVTAVSPDLRGWGLEDQGIDSLIAGITGMQAAHTAALSGAGLLTLLLAASLRSREFWNDSWRWGGAVTLGLVIAAGWYLTAGPTGQQWIEDGLFMEQPPYALGVQSYTFISALGDMGVFLLQGEGWSSISFGVAAMCGVIAGSFIYHLCAGKLRLEWFSDGADLLRHLIGAVLMGIGGVLGLGCTIGQGLTGMSTLALGSVLTLLMIVLGSALTMKVMFYRMVYEETASILPALLSSLVDLHLLPGRFRRLEKI